MQTTAEFLITRKIAGCVEYFYEREPRKVLAFQEEIEKYKRMLKGLHLNDFVHLRMHWTFMILIG